MNQKWTSRLKRLLTLVVMGHAAFVLGATNTVVNPDDSGPGSLRDMVANAAAGDTIIFDPALNGQTIVLSNNIYLPSTIIDARSLPGGLTIAAGGTNRLFHVNGAILYNLTLTGGGGSDETRVWSSGKGGAIYNYSYLMLVGCTLTGNTANFGGAIYSYGASYFGGLILSNCVLYGNTAIGPTGSGGAIYSEGKVRLFNCLVTNNAAVRTHSGGGNGGAIYSEGSNNGALTLVNCTLSGNSAVGYGGAINGTSKWSLQNCTIMGNTATVSGGGLSYDSYDGIAILTGCTLVGNTALGTNYGAGGGIYTVSQCYLGLTHCTLAGNSAPRGGGIFVAGQSSVALTNTIVAGNLGGDGADIYKYGNFHLEGANIIEKQFSPFTNFVDTGVPAMTNAPLLAPLANYGGPTLTMALLPGSPARDAAVGSVATNDQRGFPIVGTPDIGAYEAGTSTNFQTWIWETLNSAEIATHAPEADPDGDGASNYDEWLALTNPGDASSALRISVRVSGSDVVLRFPTVTNRHYTLWTTEALSGAWTNCGLPGLQGNGSVMAFTNSVGPNALRQFYKIQATP